MQATAHKEVEAIGRDGIKQLRVGPDAFFHVAAHLAYYEKFKKVPAVHNFADMRGVRFGSITRYLARPTRWSSSCATRPGPRCSKQSMRTKAIAVIKSGDYPLHYAYFYLYSAGGLRPCSG